MTTVPGPPAPSAGGPVPAAAPAAAVPGVPSQPTAPAGERLGPDWPALVAEVLADPSRLTLVAQPIVDVAGAVVAGYELLSRFAGPRHLTPDLWFAAADRLGVGAELEAVVVARALEMRADLPDNCFLTVNVSPHLLVEPALRDLLLAAGDLSPLVLELTEHTAVTDLTPVVELRDVLHARGALVALDDAGSGYSGLQQLTSMRPHVVKLDRALVADVHLDEAKLALAEMLGELAGRLDAWLLAEGVETWDEMDAFVRLGVPLAQGYLLGRPTPGFASLDPAVAARLRASAARQSLVESVASLVEAVRCEDPTAGLPLVLAVGEAGLRLDDHAHPAELLLPDGDGHRVAPVSLRTRATDDVVELALRLVARPAGCRFDPVVVVDDVGRAVGLVRAERVVGRLAAMAGASAGR
ncbi:EAL domain-containing protein [Pseudokineococcus lusitanus]|uniref:EAL domain-containing protein (Putative c-di-GMP-specific phosphodiesterase class I) n=1 Tax=Pseudokineococcus lusitanus TaxID=763993 RepID=A0A3N1HTV5_9ACTN|nr:EAL domain-containing protein [Pseudokineococcus lusitanus]ROP45836.1 EAL domain-containing protein (putative c-di-GMP-specific phosphodiesterase class I) [Pseudokineococcus lusitanus]